MVKDNYDFFIEIEGRKIPSRIWIGNLFNCSASLNYFSIFVILPIIVSIIAIGESPFVSNPLYILLNLVNICGVLSWIYGINDLSKLRKRGFIEMNISLFSLDISFIINLIFYICAWHLSLYYFIGLFLFLLIIYWNNYILFKIYNGWDRYKHLFIYSNSDYIPFYVLLFIFIIIYLGKTFSFSTNIYYYLHQLLNCVFE